MVFPKLPKLRVPKTPYFYFPLISIFSFAVALSSAMSSCGHGTSNSVSVPVTSAGALQGTIYTYTGIVASSESAESIASRDGYSALGGAEVIVTCGNIKLSAITSLTENQIGFFMIDNIPAGSCIVNISKIGYVSYQETVNIFPGKTQRLSTEYPVMTLINTGKLKISVNVPSAMVYFDGANQGYLIKETTQIFHNIDPGEHTVSITLNGFVSPNIQNISIVKQYLSEILFFLVPNNEYIYFASERDSDFDNEVYYFSIYRMKPDGSEVERMTPDGVTQSQTYPSISADGKKLVFQQRTIDTNILQVFLMDVDNKSIIQLTNSQFGSFEPSISYDGKYIIYTELTSSLTGGDCFGGLCGELQIMDTEGKLIRRVTNNQYTDKSAKISPDGKYIAFVSARPTVADYDIYRIDFDGSNETRITNAVDNGGTSQHVSWSPDGNSLLFYSSHPVPGIYCTDKNGNNNRMIIETPGGSTYSRPSFSPNGQKIAFGTSRYNSTDRGSEIAVIDLDGSNMQRLTDIPGNDIEENPTWTP